MRIDHRVLMLPLVLVVSACAPPSEPAAPPAAAAAPVQSPVERGKYLTTIAGCHDCHTPKSFGPNGPEPDMSRALSGHPAGEKPLTVPKGVLAQDKWGMLGNNQGTLYAGLWGISYARNLTPDTATGLGSWTEEMFVKTIRDGKHQGEGRPLLPPMPWQVYKEMTDDDLKAVFAFLKSLPAVSNAVPDPVPAEKLSF